MGAWIEIGVPNAGIMNDQVAPYMGAWIEIKCKSLTLPSRRLVAPYMGAWIEIAYTLIVLFP